MSRFGLIKLLVLLFLLSLACQLPGSGPAGLSIRGTDAFTYVPASATITAGEEVTLTFANEGALQHNWALVPTGVDPLTVTVADAVDGIYIEDVERGETVTLTFTAPAPGAYEYVCTIPGHANAGMVGQLTVQPE